MKPITTLVFLLLGIATLQAQQAKYFMGTNGKYGFKDQNGNIIVQPKYDSPPKFSEGLSSMSVGFRYFVSAGKWSYVDTTGKEVITLKDIDWAGDFGAGGLAVISKGKHPSKKFGLIDKNGKQVTSLKYDDIWSPFDGLRKVKVGNRLGYVSAETGKEVISVNYDEAEDFKDGKALVKKDGRGFYIGKTGKEVK